jgi:DNA-binding NarL/FixJ family response regulator
VPTINVSVLADDVITGEGAIARLSSYQGIAAQPLVAEQSADIVLMLATVVTGDLLNRVKRLRTGGHEADVPLVIVANEFPEHSLLRATKYGLVSSLRRQEVGYDQIVQNLVAALPGPRNLSQDLQRHLHTQLRTVHDRVLHPHGFDLSGLTTKEIEVLSLLADGLTTRQAAAKLRCSERTVKSVIHGVVDRLNLSNRTHAVAYALRSGAL